MTDMEKEKIRYLRGEGLGYKAIASRLALSENTVKSFCRRNGLSGVADKCMEGLCRHCGKPLASGQRGKPKKFCSESCRRAWWKSHPYLSEQRAYYRAACEQCGKEFESYGNKNRKYCGHACYIKARFGKEGSYDERTI
jgi:endogenous inhibitor of DNA gyrase (YacG/DUF329 family)